MLARDVELVIADEPTANLDPGLMAEVAGLLKLLSQKVPVIVVTHDPRPAEMCDRTIVLQSAVTLLDEGPRAQGGQPSSNLFQKKVIVPIVATVIVIAISGGAAFELIKSKNSNQTNVAAQVKVSSSPSAATIVAGSAAPSRAPSISTSGLSSPLSLDSHNRDAVTVAVASDVAAQPGASGVEATLGTYFGGISIGQPTASSRN